MEKAGWMLQDSGSYEALSGGGQLRDIAYHYHILTLLLSVYFASHIRHGALSRGRAIEGGGIGFWMRRS